MKCGSREHKKVSAKKQLYVPKLGKSVRDKGNTFFCVSPLFRKTRVFAEDCGKRWEGGRQQRFDFFGWGTPPIKKSSLNRLSQRCFSVSLFIIMCRALRCFGSYLPRRPPRCPLCCKPPLPRRTASNLPNRRGCPRTPAAGHVPRSNTAT